MIENDIRSKIAKPVGLGTANLQPYLDTRLSKQILYAALDAGITYFDTAPRYGLSEEFLGTHLPKTNDSIVIATKVGLDPLNLSSVSIVRSQLKTRMKRLLKRKPLKSGLLPHQPIKPSIIYTFRAFQASIHRSLKLLQKETLDVLHIHEPENIINLEEIFDWMTGMKQAGLIRHRGLAVHRVGSNMLDTAVEPDIIFQFPWNYRDKYQTKTKSPILFGTGELLYSAGHPEGNLKYLLAEMPRAIVLIQTSNPSNLQWIKSL